MGLRTRLVSALGIVLTVLVAVCAAGAASERRTPVVTVRSASSNVPPSRWLRRPLRLRRLGPGADCPRTSGRPANEYSSDFGYAYALGRGPVFPVPATPARYTYNPDARGEAEAIRLAATKRGKWFGQKILWIVAPTYRGWVLIRGRRLDGSGRIYFGPGLRPTVRFLWLHVVGSKAWAGGWPAFPSVAFLRTTGCYGLQIDGSNFRRFVIIKTVL